MPHSSPTSTASSATCRCCGTCTSWWTIRSETALRLRARCPARFGPRGNRATTAMAPHPTDLAAILAELRALRESHDHLARRLIPAADREDLRALLPLIDALMGDQTWTQAALYADSIHAPGADDLQRRLDDWNT